MITLIDIINESSCWNDIYLQLVTQNTKQANITGKLFEEFCRYYYLCEPSIKREYKNVWQFSELPHAIRSKLGLGKIDHGVDLVLEGYEGELSVVQCKFRSDQSSKISWTKDSLANLFAEGDKADYLVVFTNASGIDSHSLSKKLNQLKLISLGDLLNISEETITAIKHFILNKSFPKRAPKKPREYQELAINEVIKGFNDSDRGQLILPCGAGKTLVSLWIQEKIAPNHTLALFPSLALLRQTKNEWSANQASYTPYMCVCSERDIDKSADYSEVHIYEINGRVSTDPNEIQQFLIRHPKTIIYSTYQSLEAISLATKPLDFQFDLAICDEAHKTSGSKLGAFGLIHDDNNIKVKKRLYMTATPRVISDKLKDESKDEIKYLCDMSNPNIFGSEFYRMSFKEAIDQEILVDYKITAIGISDLELERAIKERKYTGDNETIDEIANNYALAKFMKEHNSSHAITFHSSIAKAEAFKVRHAKLYKEIDSFHVSGKQTTNDRNMLINEFANSSNAVITNAKCLTEGVDIPVIDTVYFCDPKNSKIDIVQAAGRALRRADHKGKTIGHIVVPIYHRDKDELDSIIDDSPFKNLVCVVMALSDHDERLQDDKTGKGQRGLQSKHISISTDVELIALEGFEEQLKNSLFSQIIDKVKIPWRKFEEARRFARELELTNWEEWQNFSKTEKKPTDIPACPNSVYKKNGWISWGDWLGTNRIATQQRKFKEFHEARDFVRGLKFKNQKEWITYAKSANKPEDIPASPRIVYKDEGWVSFGDWLGTKRIATRDLQYKNFKDARAFVRKLKLNTISDWYEYCKSGQKPIDVPALPHRTYKRKGWVSVGDWLGTERISNQKKKFLPFNEARKFVHKLNFKRIEEWLEYCKSGNKPAYIPSNPDKEYKDKGWVSTRDWLGTNKPIKTSNFLLFDEARNFARSLNLRGKTEW
jgi:predicted helicase